MVVRREVVFGVGTFVVIFVSALALGLRSTDDTVRSFGLLVGLGAGGAMSVLLTLAYHLATGPRGQRYEPIQGDGGAWGLMEWDEEHQR